MPIRTSVLVEKCINLVVSSRHFSVKTDGPSYPAPLLAPDLPPPRNVTAARDTNAPLVISCLFQRSSWDPRRIFFSTLRNCPGWSTSRSTVGDQKNKKLKLKIQKLSNMESSKQFKIITIWWGEEKNLAGVRNEQRWFRRQLAARVCEREGEKNDTSCGI